MQTSDETFVKNLEEKTGKTIAQWVQLVERSGIEKHADIIALLKSDHGFTYGYANYIALKFRKSDAGSSDTETLINEQYKGEKSWQRPIYDELVKRITAFGGDVTIEPKKTYVSLRRKKQFALIQPSTKTRLDIGINIKGKATTEKLELSGSFNAMCSHRVRIADASDVDKDVITWLKEAYDAAG